MIIPPKEIDRSSKFKSAGITVAVVSLLFLLLQYLYILDLDQAKIYVTELSLVNLSQFQKPIIEPEITTEPEKESLESEPETQQSSSDSSPSLQRKDVSSLLNQGVQVDLSANRNLSSSKANTSQSQSLNVENIQSEARSSQTLRGGNLTSAPSGRRSIGGGASGSTGLGMSGGPDLGSGRRSLGGSGGGGLLGGPQGREGLGSGKEVTLKKLTDFGSGYSDVKPIIHRLIAWMKKNPASLPIPVRRTMTDGRWDPVFLTSRVPFTIQNRQFDLMLMVKEEQLEVHIFLVEKNGATYLIDRGLQGESSFLRRGNVVVAQGDIAEVDSRMQQASVNHTQEFYQVFLSWWESVDN